MDDYHRRLPCSSSPCHSPRSSRLRNVRSPRHSPGSSRLWNAQSLHHLCTSAELETEAESANMEGLGASYLVVYLMDKDGKHVTRLLHCTLSSASSSSLAPILAFPPSPSTVGGWRLPLSLYAVHLLPSALNPTPCCLKLCCDTFVGVVLTLPPLPPPAADGFRCLATPPTTSHSHRST